ncbi:serine/threonine-protein kinase bud32 [Pleomassaria siparia CBS 279.74]|uniref:EKC/KEOPS complex subunit BUD32 n=1 Tax=Pleomassaria siparia CBS 279.74 TaxID=1314801 RepID=A0A6G1KBJ6_9PLEO|nr:serine/threonine-protein kinase bud32 [Pleomassaria siparia CBS 279.74]
MASIPTPGPEYTTHILPAPFTSSPLTLLAQGAEALVYRTTFLTPNTPCILKYRPPKPYRHPILDKRLTRARLLAEARVLVKCRRDGVKVPAVLGLDADQGWLVLEWVEGGNVRSTLDRWVKEGGQFEKLGESSKDGENKDVWEFMRAIGTSVGKVHDIGVCHGDLTTSNLMVKTTEGHGQAQPQKPSAPAQPYLTGDIILIDFGLATQTVQDEDRAVDLYVLERAFAATHPGAESLFQEVLRAYGESYRGGRAVLKKLEDVRLRGRKRSMLG